MNKSIQNSIIIDVGIAYTRVAICEKGKLNKLILENNNHVRDEGTIYQGMVSNVVKGINAAFIEIGLEKRGFLHFNDIPGKYKKLLKNNKRLAVQIVKEGVKNKGPKVTSLYNIKSEFLVLLPNEDVIGISRKIKDKKVRRKLKSLANKVIKGKYGLIVRTKARVLSEEQFNKELKNLIHSWEKIKPRIPSASVGEILYKEPNLIINIIREYLNDNTKDIVINNEEEGQNIIKYIKASMFNKKNMVRIADNTANLYSSYGIEKDIKKALGKYVWLKSGANIVIDQTEAMHVIDVNTAKLIKIKNKNKMILKANKEAAKESARQIKIRNLSGIIVIDFIDMNNKKDKNIIYNILNQEFKTDDCKVEIYSINDLGLLQMTREKRSNSLRDEIMVPCNDCNNNYGYKSSDYRIVDIEYHVRELIRGKVNRKLNIEVGTKLYNYIIKQSTIKSLENKYNIEISLIKNNNFRINKFIVSINPK